MADVESRLHEAEQGLADLRAEIGEGAPEGDAFDAVGDAFAQELRELLGQTPPASGAVRRAARLAVAEQAWEQRLGELLDTRDVVEIIGVSRQRVSRLVADRRLIALPQGGRPRFPAWQF
ncbi:MAG: helix-turn-helix domain-containing protein, partial [Actinomycetota bacterium]|nr:helix-turn-helix domain-containing protein [Actinomycetota bacterium]